jgi:hypothetical protein
LSLHCAFLLVFWSASLLQIWGGFAPTAVSNKLYQLFVHGRWFSPGTPTSTTKTGRHDIAEILLKVALKHQKQGNPTT